ncbi:Myosin light chain kinase A [Porphyridium purpureum]|uniref:Myosin light chain kinase A n=1 Tax=Porphyridium purpureum TaxID=35688 RepID=A0A5J4YJG0_PORPP|nr:Myosin light chain kinase A [Porphyridium purpureum]|eukprot:POR5930..scf255_21
MQLRYARLEVIDEAGWLYKKGKRFQTKVKRYVVVKGQKLAYFEPKDRKVPKMEISLLDAKVEKLPGNAFSLKTPARVIVFYAETAQECEKWVDAISVVTQKCEDFYTLGDELGKGSFARVVVGTDKKTQEKFAIKILEKSSDPKKFARQKEVYMREMKIMAKSEHPNVVKLYDIFDTPERLFLVMEYMKGGELFDIIAEEKQFSEEKAALVLRELLEGVKYLHEAGVVHRDIKPENLLCVDKSWPLKIKLVDFGLANMMENEDTLLKSLVGTCVYRAPEMVRKQGHGPKVDMWACGVILYVMMFGMFPFFGLNDEEYLAEIDQGLIFPDSMRDDVSKQAKDLMHRLLDVNPETRFSSVDALRHPWFQMDATRKGAGADGGPKAKRENLSKEARRNSAKLGYFSPLSSPRTSSRMEATTVAAARHSLAQAELAWSMTTRSSIPPNLSLPRSRGHQSALRHPLTEPPYRSPFDNAKRAGALCCFGAGDSQPVFLQLVKAELARLASDARDAQPVWKRFVQGCVLTTNTEKRLIELHFVRDADKMKVSVIARDSDTFENWTRALGQAVVWSPETFYTFGEMVGEGLFAQVYQGTCIATKQKVAIKKIAKKHKQPSKNSKMASYVDREEKLMSSLNHPNIVRTLDVFDTEDHLYIVLEFMQGGMLFNIIRKLRHFSERQASDVMRQLGEGLRYLHAHNVVHRDIKPDNILCDRTEFPLVIKLADFGLANFMGDLNETQDERDAPLSSSVGTPFYIAPELALRVKYGAPVDMWAAGVLCYVMLSGRFPFLGFDQNEILMKIKNAEFSFPETDWKEISRAAKHVVTKLLAKDPSKRMTAEELASHPWCTGASNAPSRALTGALERSSSLLMNKNVAWTSNANLKTGPFVRTQTSSSSIIDMAIKQALELREEGYELQVEESKMRFYSDELDEDPTSLIASPDAQ